jgi:hypothetical protein
MFFRPKDPQTTYPECAARVKHQYPRGLRQVGLVIAYGQITYHGSIVISLMRSFSAKDPAMLLRAPNKYRVVEEDGRMRNDVISKR